MEGFQSPGTRETPGAQNAGWQATLSHRKLWAP